MDGAANGVGETKQQKKEKNASSVGAKWKTRKNKKEKRHGLVFHARVWNGVQWSVLQTTGFVCSGKNKKVTGGKKVESTTSTVCWAPRCLERSH